MKNTGSLRILMLLRDAKEAMMKRTAYARMVAIAAFTVLGVGMAPAATVQNKGCTNASLVGTYSYTVTGAFVAAPAPLGPYGEVGAQVFDGMGNTTVSGMSSQNGNIAPSTSVGTYTVNPDCTGTFILPIAPGIAAHYFFVIDNAGDEYQAVCLDPVAVITRVGRRLYPGRSI